MIDLHTHSTCSDGIHAPQSLVRLAESAGLSAIALTDHDTVVGIPEFIDGDSAVRRIPGIELSVDHSPGTLHITGLFIDHTSATLTRLVDDVQHWRRERNETIIAELSEMVGEQVNVDMLGKGRTGELGLPHIAAYLVESGIARDTDDAFAGFLKPGGKLYVEKRRLRADEAIAAVHGAGGLAVLAHPWTLDLTREHTLSFIARLKDAGLDGIEAYCNDYSAKEEARWLGVAKRLNLGVSAGSDFHGETVTDARLGCTRQGGGVGRDVLDKLEERLAKRR